MVRRDYSSNENEIQEKLEQENLPELFKRIYYYLYTNSNIPRAERLGAEMVRLLFCKINDELYQAQNPQMRISQGEDPQDVGRRIRAVFELTKAKFSDVFDKDERLYLDDKSIAYVVRNLEPYRLVGTSRDAIGEAFQAFWGPGLRGEKGQFFTPKNVVRMCVEMLEPAEGEKVIDPACGSGGFLVESISTVLDSSPKAGVIERVPRSIFGIDKEVDLAKICKVYMALIGDGHSNIFCLDSLDKTEWPGSVLGNVKDGTFDVVLTNPPFGARISVTDPNILRNFNLGHRWIKQGSKWVLTRNNVSKQSPQILFLERCLQLLKPGGRMAIVLPDGVFGNPSERYVLEFIAQNARILAVVSLTHETFLPSTHTKTSVVFLEKKLHLKDDEEYEVFMAIAQKVGHDKNGKRTYRINNRGELILGDDGKGIVDDDLPEIASRYRQFKAGRLAKTDHLGFTIPYSRIASNDHILIPNYYDPEIQLSLDRLRSSGEFDLVSIGQLVERGLLSIRRGNEVGSRYYGMGDVPFVRTSDIANWEIRVDPIKCIPEEIYEMFRKRQDISENDVLLVSDGTFLIGRSGIVTRFDKRMVVQSHIRILRCRRPNLLHPYMLLYLLNTEIVQRQIEARTFVQATISTLGGRLREIIFPIPKDDKTVSNLISQVAEIIKLKEAARERTNLLLSGNLERPRNAEWQEHGFKG